jgi:hypothetical protein
MTMIEQNRQSVSALIIDKKKMKLADSNLPKAAIEQTPWYVRVRKLPMVKVKAGPQILTMLCDPTVYKNLPLKKLVKLEVSGAYITGFSTAKKGEKKPEVPAKKLSRREKLQQKLQQSQAESDAAKAAAAKEKAAREAAKAAKKAAKNK